MASGKGRSPAYILAAPGKSSRHLAKRLAAAIDRSRYRRTLRRSRLSRGDPSAHHAPDAAIDRQRDLARLRAAIAALPPHYRDVLVLVELGERSYAEAAAICGCELNTVRSRLSRARALIARWLDASSDRASTA